MTTDKLGALGDITDEAGSVLAISKGRGLDLKWLGLPKTGQGMNSSLAEWPMQLT